jgi:hypothetical protein
MEASDASLFSALWFRLGAGMDFSFSDNVFLRTGLTYGIRLSNDAEDQMSEMFNALAQMFGSDARASNRLGHGLDFTLAIGYRF